MTRMYSASTFALAMALVLTGCGGGGGASSAPPGAIVGTPTPTPPPPPAPPPAPPPPPPQGPQIAGVAPGGSLLGQYICGDGDATFATESDGSRRLTGFSNLRRLFNDNSLHIAYGGADSYDLECCGFGGPAFRPQDKRSSTGAGFDYFRTDSSEFELSRQSLSFATFGRVSEGAGPCFYAVGAQLRTPISQGDTQLDGLADGLAMTTSGTVRLIGSTVTGTIDYATRRVGLTIGFRGYDMPFGPFAGAPTRTLPELRASFTCATLGSDRTTLNDPAGPAGSIKCALVGPTGEAVVLTFDLTYPNGDRLFGVVAADAWLV